MKKNTVLRTFRVSLLCILLLLLISCSTGRTTVVPEVRQTVVHQHDTVTIRDSVVKSSTTIIQQADSSMMAEFGIRLAGMERAWLVRQANDKATVSNVTFVARKDSVVHDSIPVPYPKEVYKDRKLSRWQAVVMSLGYGMVAVIAAFIILAIACVIIKFKSQFSKLKP